jgi:hypothetical protein
MRHLTIPLLLQLALASCSSTPEFEHRSLAGVARADDPNDARMLAMVGNLFTAQVCTKLGVAPEPPFVIYHVSGSERLGLAVRRDGDEIVERRIVIGDVALRDQACFSVAHELVHLYASAPWDRLPHTIEEGLADYIALQLAPEFRDKRVAELERRLASITPERRARALAVTERAWATTAREVRSDAYAVGFEIVQRCGIEGLRYLCQRAQREGRERVPITWIEGSTLPPQMARP